MASARTKLGLKVAGTGFSVLFLIVIFLLMSISARYHREFDWTATGRNSLSAPSVALLRRLHGPIEIRAFVANSQAVRSNIRQLIARYRRVKHDVRLTFVNPDRHPGLTRRAGIQFNGEMQIIYGKRRQTVSAITEQAVTNALASLGRNGMRNIVFLTGNGEQSVRGQAAYDLSSLAQQLKSRGLNVRSSSLTDGTALAPHDSLLVIAGPQENLLPGQVSQIEHFVSMGGGLLWLQGQGSLHGLRPVADRLGVTFLPGRVLDPASQLLAGRADYVAVLHYGPSPIVRGLRLISVLPIARGLRIRPVAGWHATSLLDTDPGAWEVTSSKASSLRFQKGRDIPGPLTLGITLERSHDGHRQRIAVIGDSNFVANGFLGTAGNLNLAMNLVNWLAHEDAFINIPTRTAVDARLTLSRAEQLWIALGFLVGLPLAFAATGFRVWWRRRS
ncbi:MAG: GldG family protein [Acidiferrobacteraceae bacterium]